MDKTHWNHNTHYHPVILKAIPPRAATALDVGCGEGYLARKLRATIPHVTGLDLDLATLDRARSHGDDITYLQGDVMTYPFEPASFEVVTAVAVTHWLGAEAGLTRLASLVAPGGFLGVIGLGQRDTLRDLPWDSVGFWSHKMHALLHGVWDPEVPVADAFDSHATVRTVARRVLPGVRYRHHVLFRHTLVWRKPTI